jgi:glycine cleavage system T protein
MQKIGGMSQRMETGEFKFSAAPAEPKKTALYESHLLLADKSRLASFAGYLMPLWYSSISKEHKAVRETAGLFDCTHMGTVDVRGKDAAKFLNVISTNDVDRLNDGAAQYSYVLDAAGNVLDDIIVYRQSRDRFMVVANAANKDKISAYIAALQKGEAAVDVENPKKKFNFNVSVRRIDNTDAGSDARVDVALQGPVSTKVLGALSGGAGEIADLKPFHFVQTKLSGIDVIIARTGYTGAKTGFELFVNPQQAPALWDLILGKGIVPGVEPCGLGSRDSLRIEAGLPLYGHELDGEYGISPFEAGYSWAVKLEKEFFIGKAAMVRRAAEYDMEIVRLELPGQKGIRPVRQHDGVLNSGGRCAGWVLSCAGAGQSQFALAYVMRDVLKEGQSTGVYYLARSQGQVQQGRKERVGKNEILTADLLGKVVSRFAKF